MSYKDGPFEAVRRALQGACQSPEMPEALLAIYQSVSAWESSSSAQNPNEDQKIFDGLMSLYSFLENKDFSPQAQQLLIFIITSFPGFYFPRLPRASPGDNLELNLFREAHEALMLKAAPEKPLRALAIFEEQFRRSNLNLPLLAAEIASGSFYRDGPGRAGELFRSFAEAATVLQDTAAKDSPWELMNQLAVKLNNNISGFNQSYLFLKALETIKTARPSGYLRDEIVRNQTFFQRNHCWQNLDEALITKNDSSILFWADKTLTLVNELHERSHLLKLREIAASKVKKPGQSWFGAAALACMLLSAVTVIIWTEADVKKKLNLDQSRKELLQAIKAGTKQEPEEPEPENVFQRLPSQPSIQSRTGLLEYRPPLKPHGRKLYLPEIRHAVFQKIRLENLRKLVLSEAEGRQLVELEKDWQSRCEFYEYENEDREKVYWDLKIHNINLALDAQDILSSWRKTPDFTSQILNSGAMLDFSNAQHFQIVVNRLKHLGFMKASDTPKIWDEDCRRALMEFKATHLSVLDSVWDRKTQNALFQR